MSITSKNHFSLEDVISPGSKCPFLNEVSGAIKELKQDDVIEVSQVNKARTNGNYLIN